MKNLPRTLFTKEYSWEIARIAVVGLAALLFGIHAVPWWALEIGAAFGLYSLVRTAFEDLRRERKIGTELFITIAVVIAFVGGEHLAGAIVLMIILIAELIASASAERARASIHGLIGSVPRTATVRRPDGEVEVPIEDLHVGDVILVRAGQKIPVDGTVALGEASVNQAAITGESLPQEKAVGSGVYAGTVVELGALDIRAEKLLKDTLFARIIALVEEAEANQAPIQKFTDRVATYLIPIALLFVAGTYLVTRDVRMVIALLIFTSPAELGLATPLVTITAIARAAREGLLVKGGVFLEQMARVDTIVFDKTGTLTVGRPAVVRVDVLDPAFTEKTIVALAAAADRRSSHPLARAIVARAEALGVVPSEPESFTVVRGRGVEAVVDGRRALLGNQVFLAEHGIIARGPERVQAATTVYLAVDGRACGAIHLSDQVRKEARGAIDSLRASGVRHFAVFSGDDSESVRAVAEELGIPDHVGNLLPEDKIRYVSDLQQQGRIVAVVGDGINDAPALAQASVGIAMGTSGTEAAMEAADIVLMDDNLAKIVTARRISQRSYRTIKENIFVGVGLVHLTGIALVLSGVLGPVQAAAIHLGPDTLVFINSIKLLRVSLGPRGSAASRPTASTLASSGA